MSDYKTPIDIANRALQHLGTIRIDTSLGFSENSQRSDAISSCYDKLREAELRRNNWRFAIKKAVLRPFNFNTKLLAPSLYSSVFTYYQGSVVSDATGYLWVSNGPDNLGNVPGNS